MSTDFESCVIGIFEEPATLPHLDTVSEMAEIFGPTEMPREISGDDVTVPELFRYLHATLSKFEFIEKRPPNDLDKRRVKANEEALALARRIKSRFPTATAADCLKNKDMRAIYAKHQVRLPKVGYFRGTTCKGVFLKAGRPRGTKESRLNIEDISFPTIETSSGPEAVD